MLPRTLMSKARASLTPMNLTDVVFSKWTKLPPEVISLGGSRNDAV